MHSKGIVNICGVKGFRAKEFMHRHVNYILYLLVARIRGLFGGRLGALREAKSRGWFYVKFLLCS